MAKDNDFYNDIERILADRKRVSDSYSAVDYSRAKQKEELK